MNQLKEENRRRKLSKEKKTKMPKITRYDDRVNQTL